MARRLETCYKTGAHMNTDQLLNKESIMLLDTESLLLLLLALNFFSSTLCLLCCLLSCTSYIQHKA